jgi:hypothetical protein
MVLLLLKPLGAEQCIHQIDEHEQRGRATEQIFRRHVSNGPEAAIDRARIAQGDGKEDDDDGDENDAKHG